MIDPMSDYGFDSIMRQHYDNAVKREKKRVEEARRKKNVAAVVDFTSNLLSLIARGKGVRYPFSTNLMPEYKKMYDKAKERYGELLLDFNGKIAGGKLRGQRDRIGGLNLKFPASSSGISLGGRFRLSDGTLEKTLNDYYSNNK